MQDDNFGFPEGVEAYVRLPQYGCVAWVDDGDLMGCEMTDFDRNGRTVNGAMESDTFYCITAPETQAFLDRVNFYLGTDFELEAFAGR